MPSDVIRDVLEGVLLVMGQVGAACLGKQAVLPRRPCDTLATQSGNEALAGILARCRLLPRDIRLH